MKNSKNLIYILLACPFLFAACSKDDDTPDPMQAFVGNYTTETYGAHLVSNTSSMDTIYQVPAGTKLEILSSEGNSSEMEMELDSLVGDMLRVSLSVNNQPFQVNVNFQEKALAGLTGNILELKPTDFMATLSGGNQSILYQGKIWGEAIPKNDNLVFDYQFTLVTSVGSGMVSGVVELVRQ